MREMKPDIDEPKKKRKDEDSGELDLPLGELDAIEPEQAEADSNSRTIWMKIRPKTGKIKRLKN